LHRKLWLACVTNVNLLKVQIHARIVRTGSPHGIHDLMIILTIPKMMRLS
jgi:hypothetical protein